MVDEIKLSTKDIEEIESLLAFKRQLKAQLKEKEEKQNQKKNKT